MKNLNEQEISRLKAEMKLLCEFCPHCGRIMPPKDLDPAKLTDWLLNNDPLFRRAYDLGRFFERNSETVNSLRIY